MYKYKYRCYYIGFKGREQFINEISYNDYEELFYKYDGKPGLRVFKFGQYVLIINNKEYGIILMN